MPRPLPELTVTFHRDPERGAFAWWEASGRRRRPVRGGYMPIGRGVIPHDLAHLAVEAHFGITDGFWGLLVRGATFKRGTDRRSTRTGRALVAEHRTRLHHNEQLGNAHHGAWMAGDDTPVKPTFDRLAALWRAVPPGGVLRVDWPSAHATPGP